MASLEQTINDNKTNPKWKQIMAGGLTIANIIIPAVLEEGCEVPQEDNDQLYGTTTVNQKSKGGVIGIGITYVDQKAFTNNTNNTATIKTTKKGDDADEVTRGDHAMTVSAQNMFGSIVTFEEDNKFTGKYIDARNASNPANTINFDANKTIDAYVINISGFENQARDSYAFGFRRIANKDNTQETIVNVKIINPTNDQTSLDIIRTVQGYYNSLRNETDQYKKSQTEYIEDYTGTAAATYEITVVEDGVFSVQRVDQNGDGLIDIVYISTPALDKYKNEIKAIKGAHVQLSEEWAHGRGHENPPGQEIRDVYLEGADSENPGMPKDNLKIMLSAREKIHGAVSNQYTAAMIAAIEELDNLPGVNVIRAERINDDFIIYNNVPLNSVDKFAKLLKNDYQNKTVMFKTIDENGRMGTPAILQGTKNIDNSSADYKPLE